MVYARLLPVLIITWFASSCVSYKPLLSFEEGVPTPATEQILHQMELRIQPEDLLRIEVYSPDPKAVAAFNLQTGQQGGNMNNNNMGGGNRNQGGNNLELFMGYFVSPKGTVDLPYLGTVEVGNLTLEQAKTKILQELQIYVKDPVVNIRFLNFKVTILGEVNRPGTIQLTNERVTLLDALGMAGDLTIYAKRDEILVIREQDGQRNYERLDLQDYDIFLSPYFYLQQNDVVYVEPIRARTATVSDPLQRIISYSSGILSVITLIIALDGN